MITPSSLSQMFVSLIPTCFEDCWQNDISLWALMNLDKVGILNSVRFFLTWIKVVMMPSNTYAEKSCLVPPILAISIRVRSLSSYVSSVPFLDSGDRASASRCLMSARRKPSNSNSTKWSPNRQVFLKHLNVPISRDLSRALSVERIYFLWSRVAVEVLIRALQNVFAVSSHTPSLPS